MENLANVIRRLLNERVNEERYPSGRGKYRPRKKLKSFRGKMPVYDTIKDALKKAGPGHIFTTNGAGRTYVISKRSKGGSDPESVVSGKIAKGFTPGSSTPSSKWSSIKSHAARTKVKHGKASETKLTAKARRAKDKPGNK